MGPVCSACQLSDLVRELIGDAGDSKIAAALHAHYASNSDPKAAARNLRRSPTTPVLAGIVRGTIPATHATIDALAPNRRSLHLRELLIHVGALPPIDIELHAFEVWADDFIGNLAPAHALILRPYVAWSLLRRPRFGQDGPVRASQTRHSRSRLKEALRLLQWLDTESIKPVELDQTILASYIVTHSPDLGLQGFVTWLRRHHGARAVIETHPHPGPTRPASEGQRREAYDAILNDNSPPRRRLACALIVLLGTPLPRLVTLTHADFADRDGNVSVAMTAGKWTTLPPAVAALYRETRAPGEKESDWVFRGDRLDRHLSPHTASHWMRRYELSTLHAQKSAIFELVETLAPKIVADTTGVSQARAYSYAKASSSYWLHMVDIFGDPNDGS